MAVGDERDDERDLRARIALLERTVAARDAELAERDATIAALTEQVATLSGQVEKLPELLGQNSKNSHLPPSSDGPSSKSSEAGTSKRKKSGRKRGGQKGHRGSHRELLPAERVDTFVDLFPEVCLGCARALPEVVDIAACRYQQIELRDHRPR